MVRRITKGFKGHGRTEVHKVRETDLTEEGTDRVLSRTHSGGRTSEVPTGSDLTNRGGDTIIMDLIP